MKDGIHKLTNSEYHACGALSSSQLGKLLKSPAHYKWAKEFPMSQTTAMIRGTLTHTLVLEPTEFDKEFVICEIPKGVEEVVTIMTGEYSVYDGKVRRGKAWDEFEQAHPGEILLASQVEKAELYLKATHNRTPVKQDDYDMAFYLAKAVIANPVAAALINHEDAVVEESIFWTDFATGIQCKCRSDLRIGSHIYDLKTTADASPRAFQYSAKKFGYERQAAWYSRGVATQHQVENFGFIVVDKEQPYQCTVFHALDHESLASGNRQANEAIKILAHCLETNEWPGYPEEYETITI